MMGVLETVAGIMDQYGIPEYVWFPIMQLESGGNPNAQAITTKEKSIGLFQINLKAHPEYAGLDLTDPAINANIAARDFMKKSYDYAVSIGLNEQDQTAWVWRRGIRPAWNETKEAKVKALAGKVLSGGVGGLPEYSLSNEKFNYKDILEGIDQENVIGKAKGTTVEGWAKNNPSVLEEARSAIGGFFDRVQLGLVGTLILLIGIYLMTRREPYEEARKVSPNEGN
jgi:hypothetical protein